MCSAKGRGVRKRSGRGFAAAGWLVSVLNVWLFSPRPKVRFRINRCLVLFAWLAVAWRAPLVGIPEPSAGSSRENRLSEHRAQTRSHGEISHSLLSQGHSSSGQVKAGHYRRRYRDGNNVP